AAANADSSQVELNADSKNPLGSKISKVIDYTLQADESFFEGLKNLSEIYTTNDVRSRRNLRGIMETSRLELAEGFLREMSAIKEGLDHLSVELSAMSASCSKINERLKSSKSRMEELISQTNLNQTQKNSVTLTHLAADVFLKSFYIDRDDWTLLDGPVDNLENVLVKLERAKNIRHLIITTMGIPNMPLLKDLLETSTSFIDKAFERLYQWVKNEVTIQSFEAVEVPIIFRKCLQELQERPILFKCILDEYANARRQVIVEAFLSALTVGWDKGGGTFVTPSSKPIEMQSHDPTRYAGDMLAWLHQAAASEKEYLLSLTSENGMQTSCVTALTPVFLCLLPFIS
uniref:Conserved oligomeric Golgi complex subunit 6 n=1 Tax=Mesocestoides corti TaxID=53468 RepID=A0A5K3FG41_MESCO